MPHLRLEYSTNIQAKDLKKVLALCQDVLVTTVNADLFRCQSRVIPCEQFYVGHGGADEAFIYLELLLLEGRSLAQLQEAGKRLLHILEKHFAQAVTSLNVQIAVRVIELSTDRYFKVEQCAGCKR